MVTKAPTLKKYVPYINRKKSSGGSSSSANRAKQNAISDLNQKVAQLNKAIDEGRYSDATGSLKEEYSKAKSKAQSVGAIVGETDAQVQARLEQARLDFIKKQEEAAKAARARIELQAQRASGEVALGQTVQLTQSQQAELDKIKPKETGDAPYEKSGTIAKVVETTKKGLQQYKEAVVEPIRESTVFKGYERNIVQPLSQNVLQPAGKVISKGAVIYEREVVDRVKKAIPGLENTPIGTAAQAKRIIDRLPPDQEVVIGSGGTRRRVKAGTLQNMSLYDFSKTIVLGEVEETFSRISQKAGASEQTGAVIGKVASVTTGIAPYLVSGVFGAEYGLRIGEAAAGGKTGGAKNIVQFVQENPLETAVVVGGAALKGVKFLKSSGTGGIKYNPKYKQYLDEKYKQVKLEAETKIKTRSVKGTKLQQKTVKLGEDFAKRTLTKKGVGDTLKVQYQQPTGTLRGTVQEIHKSAAGKDIIYNGQAVYKNGVYTETINLGKNLKKITVIDDAGKGTVKIFKSGKEVVNIPLKDASLPNLKLKSSQLQSEKTLSTPIKKTSQFNKLRQTDDVISLKTNQPDATTGLFREQSKFTIKSGLDVKSGIKKTVEIQDNIIDLTRVKPEIKVVSSAKGLTKKTIPQNIIYGSSDDVAKSVADKSLFYKSPTGSDLLVKDIQPRATRSILGTQKQTFVFTYGDDVIRQTAPKTASQIVKGKDVKSLNKLKPGKYTLSKSGNKVIVDKLSVTDDVAKKLADKSKEGVLSFTVGDKGKVVKADYLVSNKAGEGIGKELLKDLEKLSPGKKIVIEDASKIPGYYSSQGYQKIPIEKSPGIYPTYTKTAPVSEFSDDLTKQVTKFTKAKTPNSYGILPTEQLFKTAGEVVTPSNVIGFAQVPKDITTGLIGGGAGFAVVTKELTKQKAATNILQKQDLSQLNQNVTLTNQSQDTVSDSTTTQTQKPEYKPAQKPATRSPNILLNVPTPTPSPMSPQPPSVGVSPPTPRTPETPRGVPPIPNIEREYRLSQGQGYNAEYVPQGQKKYEKINKIPQTLMSALSTMAKKVDNTLSARGRVVKAKPKVDKKGRPVQPLNTGDRYFERNQNKFRTFRSIRGRKGALQQGTFIEKQSFRLDTPGERGNIQRAKNRRTPFGF